MAHPATALLNFYYNKGAIYTGIVVIYSTAVQGCKKAVHRSDDCVDEIM